MEEANSLMVRVVMNSTGVDSYVRFLLEGPLHYSQEGLVFGLLLPPTEIFGWSSAIADCLAVCGSGIPSLILVPRGSPAIKRVFGHHGKSYR
jgi:hypothetical protein